MKSGKQALRGQIWPVIQHVRGRAGARMQSPPHSWTGVGLRNPTPRLASGFQAPWGRGWDSWALGASDSGVPSGDSHPLLPDLFARNASHGDLLFSCSILGPRQAGEGATMAALRLPHPHSNAQRAQVTELAPQGPIWAYAATHPPSSRHGS